MERTYSNSLRERVVKAVIKGGSSFSTQHVR